MNLSQGSTKNLAKAGVLLAVVVIVIQVAMLGSASDERSWIFAQGATATYQPTSTKVPTPIGGVPTTSATEDVQSVTNPGAAFAYTSTPVSGSTAQAPMPPTPTSSPTP